MGDKIDANKTVYQTGTPMFTPIDPFVRKQAAKLEQYDRDHMVLQGPYNPQADPLTIGPYATPQPTPAPAPNDPPPRNPQPTPTPTPTPTPGPRANKPAEKKATAPGPAPQGVSRPVYTGGAPALRPDQMDQAVIDGNLILKTLYALPEKLSWLRTGYMGLTRVAGPAGAILNLGYNIISAKRILSDPKAPLFLKGGIVTSTALAGVSAATATRLAASAFGWAPMATESLKAMGKVCGLAGLGAGTLLSAMDTFNTFRDPNATSAEKGFSTLATGASLGLTVAVLLGVTGPLGIGLGIGAIAFTLAKGFLGHNKVANAVFGAVGHAASSVGHAIAHGLSKLKFW